MEEKEDKPKTLYSAFKQPDVWVLTISESQEVFPEVHRTFDGCREGVRKDLSAYYPDDVLEKLWVEVEKGLESSMRAPWRREPPCIKESELLEHLRA